MIEMKTMRINRSEAIDNLVFTSAMTVASQALIFRDRLLGRVKRPLLENHPRFEISKRRIMSGKQYLDAVFVAPATEPPQAALLLCHGIAETVEHWFGVQTLLAAQGVASLVFDYAGYGKSTGRIDWKQCEEDAIEAFGALKVLLPDISVSILGFSLGSGIAAAVLDRVLPQKLILCSSFTSFRAAACCAGLPRALSFMAPPIWNTLESLRYCSVPVLILHCGKDRLFPTSMASSLAGRCEERAKLVIVSNQRHNDPFYRPDSRFWDHVVSNLVADHLTVNQYMTFSEKTI